MHRRAATCDPATWSFPLQPMAPTSPLPPARASCRDETTAAGGGRGFGESRGRQRSVGKGEKGRRRRGSGLSAADRQPLGRSPDLEAMRARHRLGLPLVGRLGEEQVNRAWKREAAEHHPDRGGVHGTMQAINAARDLLLGRA